MMEEQAIKSTIGKNGNNFAGNLAQLLGSILGGLVSAAQTGHIPPSVLNKGVMNKVIANNVKMQGRMNSFIKPSLKKAVAGNLDGMPSMLSGLFGGGGLAALSGMMSNLGSLTGGVSISIPSIPPVPMSNVQSAIQQVASAPNIEITMKCLRNYV